METLLKLNHAYIDGYTKEVGNPMATHMMMEPQKNYSYEYRALQTNLQIKLQAEYMEAFNTVLARGFILPQEFQGELKKYFEMIADLFENKNDENLGVALHGLYDSLADITDKLNNYFKIEKLSRQMNNIL
jgi:hypothetical protein